MKTATLPPYRDDIRKIFGHISFQCLLVNLDIVGIRSRKTNEIIIVIYRGSNKVGYLYESGNLAQQQIFAVYNDAPQNWNDLERWEESMKDKIELLQPPRDNYVFVSDREVVNMNKIKSLKSK